MTPTSTPTSTASHRAARRPDRTSSSADRARAGGARRGRDRRMLGRYIDRHGRSREVIACRGAAGSTLVVDRDRSTHEDARLVAHLAADERLENAALVCARFLEDVAAGGGRCRLLTAADTKIVPFDDHAELDASAHTAMPFDRLGCSYAIELVPSGMSIPELRWCRSHPAPSQGREPLSLRDVSASFESYEPACSLTRRALAQHDRDPGVSAAVLRAELARVRESPIVLNRRLREVVLATVERQRLTMSEIAIRCGRVKRDRRGNESGETSWLARRIGLLAEGGQATPTPWIHSDVLGLIARSGLGISPREVEL
jgi:hypothetical protein